MAGIQIFGSKKCAQSRKAQRFLRERGIPFQWIDLTQRSFFAGELDNILRVLGSVDVLLDPDKKEYCMIRYLTEQGQREKLLEDPSYCRTPILRCGNRVAVGYDPVFLQALVVQSREENL